MNRQLTFLFLLANLNFLYSVSVFAQWNLDPAANTPICVSEPYPRDFVRCVPDGEHGAYIVWLDARSFGTVEKTRVYAQRLDSAGIPLWGYNGRMLNDSLLNAGIPSSIGVDSGRCIVCWSASQYGIDNGLYTQLVNLAADGTRIWETRIWNTTLRFNNLPKLCSDGKGGVIVASTIQYADYCHLYVHRVNAAGVPVWQTNGVKVASFTNRIDFNLADDDSGGAYIAWRDLRTYGGNVHDTDIYVQRIDSAGNILWQAEGVSVKRKTGPQHSMSIAGFGPAGVCLLFRNQPYPPLNHAPDTLVMQRLSPGGKRMWGEGGISLLEGGISDESALRLDRDHLILMYTDVATGTGMIQKVDTSGRMVWNGGAPVTLGNDTHTQALLPANHGGAFVAHYSWSDLMSQHLYLQRVSDGGVLLWSGKGKLVCTAPGSHTMISSNVFSTGDIADRGLIQDGREGVIAVWCDTRYSYQGPYMDFDIFAARFDTNGDPFPVELLTFTATLVESDVCLRWQTVSEANNYGFTVQRSSDGKAWQDIGFVSGQGSTQRVQEYAFTDAITPNMLQQQALYYRLRQQDYGGEYEFSPVVSIVLSMYPARVAVDIYPNPVHSTASLTITALKHGYYFITVLDNLGRIVHTIYEGTLERGNTALPVSLASVPAGIYLLRVSGAGAATTKAIYHH